MKVINTVKVLIFMLPEINMTVTGKTIKRMVKVFTAILQQAKNTMETGLMETKTVSASFSTPTVINIPESGKTETNTAREN